MKLYKLLARSRSFVKDGKIKYKTINKFFVFKVKHVQKVELSIDNNYFLLLSKRKFSYEMLNV